MTTSDVPVGFVTQTHTGAVTWREALDWAADLGFNFVELYMDGATERTRLDADSLAERLETAGLGLAVHLPFVDVDLGSVRDRIREASIEELEACLEVAGEMGAEKAVVHPSSNAGPPEWAEDVLRASVAASIRELDEVAAGHGVELCAENLPGGLFSIHEFDDLLDETDVSMTFDTGHARVDGADESEMAAFLAEHRDRVSHVHVNDSRVARDEHVPVGSGTTDFATALEPLTAEWAGTFSIEVFTFDEDYLALSKRKLDGWW